MRKARMNENLTENSKVHKSKKARLWYTTIALILTVVAIGSLAWYATRVHYIRQDMQLAKANLQVEILNEQGNSVHGVTTNTTTTNYNDTFTTAQTVANGNTALAVNGVDKYATFYAKIKNAGGIDLDVYFQTLLNGTDYYDQVGDYISGCVVDITDEVNNTNSGSLASYIANNTVHGSAFSASSNSNKRLFTFSKLSELEDLKKVSEIENVDADGATHYYRIELWDDGSPTDITGQKLDFTFLVYGKQAGMPVGTGASTDVYHVNNENEFNEALARVVDGATIIVDSDTVISNAVTFNCAVNLTVNNCTLRIRSSLAYDYASSADCTINLVGSGELIVDGDLNIDAPSSDFTITGNGATNAVKLGTGLTGGNFFVNTALVSSDSSIGFHLNNVTVLTKQSGSYVDATMIVDGNTNVIIAANTEIGKISAATNASNIYLYIYGTVNDGIDLHEMQENTPTTPDTYALPTNYAPNGLDQIYIYVYGSVNSTTTGSYRYWLPSWAKSWKYVTNDIYTTSTCNTRIYYDIHSGISSAAGYVHPDSTTGVFQSEHIEFDYYATNSVVRLNPTGGGAYVSDGKSYSNAYRIILTDYTFDNGSTLSNVDIGSANFLVQQVLMNYFMTGDSTDPLHSSDVSAIPGNMDDIDYIEVITVQPEGGTLAIKTEDLYYLSGNTNASSGYSTPNVAYRAPLTGIEKLDLSSAYVTDNILYAGSMQNCAASEVILPQGLVQINSNAFTGAKFYQITIPSTVGTIQTDAFKNISTNNGANGYLFVTVEGTNTLTNSLMQGFTNSGNKQFIFVDETVDSDFHSRYTINTNGTITKNSGDISITDWYYKVYEYADLAELNVDANGVYTFLFTRQTAGGVELALNLRSDITGYTNVDTGAEYQSLFPVTIGSKTVTALGDRSLSHFGITSFGFDLSFSNNAHTLDLSNYTTIGNEVFKQKNGGGITVTDLNLGNISAIGDYAFFKLNVTGSVTRSNNSFKGMTELGKYAFYGSTFGTKPTAEADVTALNSATTGSLDLSFSTNVSASPGNYALASSNFYGCSLSMKNGDTINSTVFNSSTFYACDVDISGTTTVKEYALSSRAGTTLMSVACTKTNLNAIDIPFLEPRSLGSNWGTATIGLQDADLLLENVEGTTSNKWGGVSATGYYEGIFTYDTNISALVIDGELPVNCESYALGRNRNNYVKYGSVTFTNSENVTINNHKLADYLFYNSNSTHQIGSLSFEDGCGITEIGNYCFYYCQNITGPNGTLDLSGMTIGNYAFLNATINATTLTLEDLQAVGTQAFYCYAPNLATLSISMDDKDDITIGSRAFSIRNCPATATGTVEFTNCDNLTFGEYVFADNKAITTVSFGTGDDLCTNVVLGNYCFSSCSNFVGGTIEGITTVGSYCFQYCTAMKYFVSSTVASIQYRSFYNCGAEYIKLVNCYRICSAGTWVGCESFANCPNLVMLETGFNYDNYTLYSLANGSSNLKAWIIHGENATGTTTYDIAGDYNGRGIFTNANWPSDFRIIACDGKGGYISRSQFYNGTGTMNINICSVSVSAEDLIWTDTAAGTTATHNQYTLSDGKHLSDIGYGDYCYYLDSNGDAVLVTAFIDGVNSGETYTVPTTVDTTAKTVVSLGDDCYKPVDFKGNNTLVIPNSVTSLGNYCFANCTGLTAVNLSNTTNLTAGNYCFSGCTGLTTSNWDGLTSAGSYCFNGCTALTGFASDTLITIGDRCFQNCTALVYAKCPYAYDVQRSTSMGYNFSGCTSLRVVETCTLAKMSSYDGRCLNGIFYKCDNLKCWIQHGENLPDGMSLQTGMDYSGSNGPMRQERIDFKIYVPTGYISKCISSWSSSNQSIIELSLTELASLEWVDEPATTTNTITHFKDFSGTTLMSSYGYGDYLYSSVNSKICLQACFADVSGAYTVPQQLESGGVMLPVTGLGYGFFDGNKAITGITSSSQISLGNYCFRNCSALASTNWNFVTSVGQYCFQNCTGLTAFESSSATSLGTYAFSGCTSLAYFNGPNVTAFNVSPYFSYAFNGCTNLALVETGFPCSGSVSRVFRGCSNLHGWIIHTENNPTPTSRFAFQDYGNYSVFDGSDSYPSCFRIVVDKNYVNWMYFESCTSDSFNTKYKGSVILTDSTAANYYWASDTTGGIEHFTSGDGNTLMSAYGLGDYLYEVESGGKASLIACFSDEVTSLTYTTPAYLGSNALTKIEKCAYRHTSFNASSVVTVSNQVETIDNYAFKGLTAGTIVLPTSLTSLGTGTFYGSTALKTIVLNTDPSHTTTADAVTAATLFGSSCPSDVKVYMDNNAYTNVYTSAWGGIPRSQFVVTSYMITTGNVTFYLNEYEDGYIVSMVTGGNNETTITYPETYTNGGVTKNVLAIGDGSFSQLKDSATVTTLVLPRHLKSFTADYSLMPVNLSAYQINGGAAGDKYSAIDGVLYNADATTLVNYPRGKTGAIYTAPTTVKNVASGAFWNCANLQTITINQAVIFAGEIAYNCPNLTALNLTSSVCSSFLGEDTFVSVNSLFKIYIPNGMTEEYKKHIYRDSALIAFLSEIAASGSDWEYAIVSGNNIMLTRYSGTAMTTVLTIPGSILDNSVTYTVVALGNELLYNTAFTSISIPASVTQIDGAMFDGSAIAVITVDNANTVYSSYGNMLLSKDRATLYRLMPGVTGDVILTGVKAVADGALNGTGASSIDMSHVEYMGDSELNLNHALTIKSYNAVPAVMLGGDGFGLQTAQITNLTISVANGYSTAYTTALGWSKYGAQVAADTNVTQPNSGSDIYTATDCTYQVVRAEDGDIEALVCSVTPDSLGSATIPATVDGYPVTGLGESFDAANILFFGVDSGSSLSVTSGVLFSGTTLLRFPAGNTATSYTVASGVTIADNAFKGATNLTSVTMELDSFKTMGSDVFAGCNAALSVTVTIPTPQQTAAPASVGVDAEAMKCIDGTVDALPSEAEPTEGGDGDDDASEEAAASEVEASEEIVATPPAKQDEAESSEETAN